jgi:PadR family transcriptional regulator
MEGVRVFSRELKKGNTELLVLSVIESRARHGYEIGRLIEQRSGGRLRYRIASLYPLLCRLETRGLIAGRWVEKAGERRRRFYRLTADGRKALKEQRTTWQEFMDAVTRVTSPDHA